MSSAPIDDPRFVARVNCACAACEAIDDGLGAYVYIAAKMRGALASGHAKKLLDALELVAIGLDVRRRSGDTSHAALERETTDLAETLRRCQINA